MLGSITVPDLQRLVVVVFFMGDIRPWAPSCSPFPSVSHSFLKAELSSKEGENSVVVPLYGSERALSTTKEDP